MVDYYDLVAQLQDAGFFDVVLPFLLLFITIFAILEKTKIFGTEGPEGQKVPRKKINVVFGLITALIVVVNTEIIAIMNLYLSKISLVLIILLMFLVLFGLWGGDAEHGPGGWLFGLGIIVAIGGVFWALTPEVGLNLPYWAYPSDWDGPLVLGVIVAVLTLFFLLSDSTPRTRPGNRDFWEYIRGPPRP